MSPEKDKKEQARIARRSLLDYVMAAGGAVWALGMAGPAALYLWPARSAGPVESTLEVGAKEEIAVGESRMIRSHGRPILVLRSSEDEFRAFSAICTHLGCIVDWDPARQVIACPCHAAVFSPDGEVVSGPPPRPLPQYRVMLVGDKVRVKLS